MRISEASGADLDRMVALCTGRLSTVHVFAGRRTCFAQISQDDDPRPFCPSSDWAVAQELIRDEGVSLVKYGARWSCAFSGRAGPIGVGETPLLALTRAIVLSVLGDIEIQEPEKRGESNPLEHLIGRTPKRLPP